MFTHSFMFSFSFQYFLLGIAVVTGQDGQSRCLYPTTVRLNLSSRFWVCLRTFCPVGRARYSSIESRLGSFLVSCLTTSTASSCFPVAGVVFQGSPEYRAPHNITDCKNLVYTSCTGDLNKKKIAITLKLILLIILYIFIRDRIISSLTKTIY